MNGILETNVKSLDSQGTKIQAVMHVELGSGVYYGWTKLGFEILEVYGFGDNNGSGDLTEANVESIAEAYFEKQQLEILEFEPKRAKEVEFNVFPANGGSVSEMDIDELLTMTLVADKDLSARLLNRELSAMAEILEDAAHKDL